MCFNIKGRKREMNVLPKRYQQLVKLERPGRTAIIELCSQKSGYCLICDFLNSGEIDNIPSIPLLIDWRIDEAIGRRPKAIFNYVYAPKWWFRENREFPWADCGDYVNIWISSCHKIKSLKSECIQKFSGGVVDSVSYDGTIYTVECRG